MNNGVLKAMNFMNFIIMFDLLFSVSNGVHTWSYIFDSVEFGLNKRHFDGSPPSESIYFMPSKMKNINATTITRATYIAKAVVYIVL
jgi:hypothetical protein